MQKFISHFQGHKVDGSTQGDTITVLISDSRMIDTIMNEGVKTKDIRLNVIAAGDSFGIHERNEEDKYR